MKKITTLVSAIILSASLWAQAPQKFSYQAVIRGVNNILVSDKIVGVKISILQGSEFGASVYVETHTPTTNVNGLASLSIGTGSKVFGEFSKIDWAKSPYFVKIETDITGGVNYQLNAVSELMSVPFALYAANSQPGPKGDKGDIGDQGPAGKDGSVGPKGDKGDIGDQGPAGKDGLVGPKGDIGDQGPAGKDGLVGPKGDKGDIGDQGPAGKDGSVGPKGDKGDTPEVKVTVSVQGDTLKFENGSYVIIPGISAANPKTKPTSGYGENIKDVNGNSYKTVYIGTQQWMGENLKVSKYNDGTEIPNVIGNSDWTILTTGAWCYYNNDILNNEKYGNLYNWFTISPSFNGNKNVCPLGWHVPSDSEWNVLIDYLGGENIAGGKMKESGTDNWINPNIDASNISLYTAIPAGSRGLYGDFNGVGNNAVWWSSTESSNDNSIYFYLSNNNTLLYKDATNKKHGESIRCIKD